MTKDDERDLLHERLASHASACEECAVTPPRLAEIARGLAGFTVPLEVAALSQRVVRYLRPELSRLASIWYWHRLTRATLAALLPLPAILFLDAYVLRFIYAWAITLLPTAVAAYLVVSYAATQLLLIAATYAAIPLLLARDAWGRTVRAEALS